MVYVVDDSADFRFLLQQVFTRFLAHQPVRFFADGDALRQSLLTEDSPPNLILLDLHMPGLSGLQTLSMLKQNSRWRRIPIVMMTNGFSPLEVDQCYDAGANSFLVKPSDFLELKGLMETVCHYWLELNQYRPD